MFLVWDPKRVVGYDWLLVCYGGEYLVLVLMWWLMLLDLVVGVICVIAGWCC